MYRRPVWVCATAVWATEMVSSSCFPSPFSVHVSAVKCIQCFLGEKRDEGATEFSGRTEQLWSCCEPARADPPWEKASVRASPAGPSFGTNAFTLSSTSGFLFPPEWLLESYWGREGGLIVNQNIEILKPDSP